MCRIAMISAHGSPIAQPGTRETGGMNVYVRELSRELGQRGMVVDIYTRRTEPDAPTVEYFAENVQIIRLKAGVAGQMPKDDVFNHLPELVCQIVQFAQAHGYQYQYVHSHYWLSGWVGGLLALRWHLPHISMFHTLALLKNAMMPGNVESPRRIEAERRVIATATALVAATEHERDAMVDLYGGEAERIHVIPCGVDLRQFAPLNRTTARAALGLAPSDEILLFVGRADPLKGLEVLIRAVALLKHRPGLRLLIAGGAADDVELVRLRELAGSLNLGRQVHFLGPISQENLSLHYTAADVCVMPSAYESFGLVAVESLACGTPVIATDVGGLRTIIRDGENGLLVQQRSPEAFAKYIECYFSNADLQSRLRSQSRRSVVRFQWGHVAERIVNLYHELGAAAVPQQVCGCHA